MCHAAHSDTAEFSCSFPCTDWYNCIYSLPKLRKRKDKFADSMPLDNPFSPYLVPLMSPQTLWMEQYVTEPGDKEIQPVLDDSLHN